ncbi:MAG TPA: insulinase family protein [Gemmatimonadaceae bacterium]|nr:insulinase family protein [Gemmatimonadaceae bacterium]
MKRLTTTLALALAASVGALGAQEFPKTPPAPEAIKPAEFPPFQEVTLRNGVRLIVIERRDLPVLSISLSFPAGSFYDPAGKSGLADMVAGLLTKGAGTRSANEIAEAIESVGGSINAGAGADFLTIRADVLSPNADLAFGLVGDVAVRPTFPTEEVDLLRQQTLSALQLERSDAGALAARFFAHGLYGEHPYGIRPTETTVQAITRDDLLAFQNARIKPRDALMVVAGDISLADARRQAERALAGWTGAPAAAGAAAAPPMREKTELLIVHRPGSVQSNIVVGNTTFLPTDPIYYSANMATRVLGGGADARLFMILREQKSWTYGAYAGLQRRKGLGAFQATAEVRTEVTDSALVELLTQLRRIGAEIVPAEELANARSAAVGSFPLTIETTNQIAGAVSTAKLLGLPDDYLRMYRTRLAAVTAQQLQDAARRVIRPDAALIVVVGDATRIYDRLKDIAPTRIVDVEGAPIEPSALTVAAEALPLDASKLAARTDSFTILVQGNPFGFQKSTLTKTDDGFLFVEEAQIGPIMSQKTEVTLSGTGETRTVTQAGKVQGQDMKIDVTIANGRATGSATTPGPQGMKSVTVDTEVPGGIIDDNGLTALIPALPWSGTSSWSFPVLASGDGTVKTYTFKVTGTESVTVPAGTFESFVVALSGGQQPATLYITTEAPHRVVKMTVAGAPIEMVRAK